QATFVSSGVVGTGGFVAISYEDGGKASAARRSAPIGPSHVTHWTSAADFRGLSARSISLARSGETGLAPRATASAARPSVPFRPTRPPIPAIGFTTKPTRFTIQRDAAGYFGLPRPCAAGATRHAWASSDGGATAARWTTYPIAAIGINGHRGGARITAVERPAAIPNWITH